MKAVWGPIRQLHILNLGGGKQSTRLYLGFLGGEYLDGNGEPIRINAAVFADTGDERQATYKNIEWLQQLGGPPILVRRHPNITLGSALLTGMNGHGGRFVTIPAFTTPREGDYRNKGITRRQCTKEFKTTIIERTIRREFVGLQPRQPLPATVEVHRYFGISWDERSRAVDIERRLTLNRKGKPLRGYFVHFPLLDPARRETRMDCDRYLRAHVPHEVIKSACKFCPFHSDQEWQSIKDDPDQSDWNAVVQIDRALRTEGTVANRKFNYPLYLHEACRPIDQIAFDNNQEKLGFLMECSGMCGH